MEKPKMWKSQKRVIVEQNERKFGTRGPAHKNTQIPLFTANQSDSTLVRQPVTCIDLPSNGSMA